jgi:proteasome activator subunit 4
VQKLVNSLANDCLTYLSEEAHHTHAYSLETPRVNDAIRDLEAEFTPNFVNQRLLAQAHAKSLVRIQKRGMTHNKTASVDLLLTCF